MNLNITGHHVEITEAIRAHVISKLERVIKHFDHATRTDVILSVDKMVQKAEISMHVRGKDLFAESTHEDLYCAIEAVSDKLDRQVLKHKQKTQDHHHEGHKRFEIE